MEGFEFIILTEKSASFYGVFIEITEDILKMSSIKCTGFLSQSKELHYIFLNIWIQKKNFVTEFDSLTFSKPPYIYVYNRKRGKISHMTAWVYFT